VPLVVEGLASAVDATAGVWGVGHRAASRHQVGGIWSSGRVVVKVKEDVGYEVK
jgi:hypothetical protein